MEKRNLSISNFRLFCVQILLPLIFILVAAGLGFNYLFEREVVAKSQISGAYKINRILTQTYPDEIPIFGDSRAEMGLLPDSVGDNFFNYGLYSTGYDVTLFFVEEECKKTKKRPELIVNLNLSGFTYGLGDISNYLYNINDDGVKKLLGDDYRPYFSIPFIKYYGRFESIFRTYFVENSLMAKVINNGASLENQSIPVAQFRALVAKREEDLPIFRTAEVLQNKLLGIIKAHPNRLFVFVIAPYHPCCFDSTNINTGHAFIHMLRTYKNVRVFDFSKSVFDESMFFNTSHLNYKGAVYYSRLLHDSLSRIDSN